MSAVITVQTPGPQGPTGPMGNPGPTGPTGFGAATVVSFLPTPVIGARAIVTDATATTFASVVAGSGTNTVPVYGDGTFWRIG